MYPFNYLLKKWDSEGLVPEKSYLIIYIFSVQRIYHFWILNLYSYHTEWSSFDPDQIKNESKDCHYDNSHLKKTAQKTETVFY